MSDISATKVLERQFIVLGSMIADQGCLGKGISVLQDRFFSSHKALDLWKAIKACVEAGMVVDLESVSGFTKIISLSEIASQTSHVTASGFDFYMGELIDDANRKECAAKLMEAASRLLKEGTSPADEAVRCEKMFDAVRCGKQTGTCRTISEAVQDRIDHIEKNGYDDVYEFGIGALDRMTGGIAAGTFTVIAARPGIGKSTLAANMAYWMYVRGYWTAYLSMEMSNFDVSKVMIKLKNRVEMGKKVLKEDLIKYKPSIDALTIDVDHGCSGLTPSRMEAKIREMRRKHDIKMVFIDYLQLMEDDDKHKSRYEMVTRISNRIMNFAHSSGIAVVALAQINRDSEKGKDAREPRISDLRDSGAIEQDADLCMLMHSKEIEDIASIRNLTINVAKNRAGGVGKCYFVYDAAKSLFLESSK